MKILTVTPYYHPKIGGLENYARQLNIALHEQEKCEVVVVTSNHTGHSTVIDVVDELKVYRLGTWFKLSNTPLNPFWPFMISRIIKREKPDVILAHSPVPSMAEAAALVSRKSPFVLVYHAATLHKDVGSKLFNAVAHIYGFYQKLMFNRANNIIAVSEFVKQQCMPKIAAKTIMVPNSVWARDVQLRSQPLGADFIFIGSLDRTHAWKGLDLTIKAIAAYVRQFGPKVSLTIVGDGNYRHHYEHLVQTENITEHVTFLGALFGEEKDTVLNEATALICYPTTSNDAFPTVILEAWARGVPVVAAAIGPLPSLMSDGSDGYLVKPRDATALADTLFKVATAKPTEIEKIAASAADRVRNNYTWERQAAAVAKLLESLL